MKTIDILTIGNVTEDINKINKKVYRSIGGTSFYAYKVAKKLGYDLRIITEVSDSLDFSKKIDPKNIISQKLNYIQFLKIHIKMVKETKKY